MNSINDIKISIIIPNYNGGKFLEGCIISILNQNYNNYEIIIVDGKSTDNSHIIIKKYITISNKIKWINIKDNGISNGFNIGIENSNGDYVLLLGSDDYLYSGILNKINSYINKIKYFGCINIENCNFFCDAINYWSEKNKLVKRIPQTSEFTKNNLIKFGNIIGFQDIYINRKWFNKYKINENNKYSMDYETYFEMLKNGQIFIYTPEINSINYLGNNTTCKYWYQSQKEANTISLKYSNNLINYYYVFKRFIIRELLKLYKI